MNTKKELFDGIICKSYSWLKYKIGFIFPKKYVEDAVHDSILAFYKYHVNKFNINYKTNETDTEKKKRARNYFLKRFFWYLSPKTFYGKKIIEKIKTEENNFKQVYANGCNELLYSIHPGYDIRINSKSNKVKPTVIKLNEKINFEFDTEERIYLEQFKNYVKKYNMKNKVKKTILLYLTTHNKNVFKTNGTFYASIIKTLANNFNTIGAEKML